MTHATEPTIDAEFRAAGLARFLKVKKCLASTTLAGRIASV